MATISDGLETNPELVEALVALFESAGQAGPDFSGEQAEWHCPRLATASMAMMKLFPFHSAQALDVVKTPYETEDAS